MDTLKVMNELGNVLVSIEKLDILVNDLQYYLDTCENSVFIENISLHVMILKDYIKRSEDKIESILNEN